MTCTKVEYKEGGANNSDYYLFTFKGVEGKITLRGDGKDDWHLDDRIKIDAEIRRAPKQTALI